jgi:2',3'-cyclic-nucleotide 2'-phosphodiesterase (5'-nucleotidase family)
LGALGDGSKHLIEDDTCRAQDDSKVEYPEVVNGVPILQQFYASKYVGVTTLTFDTAGMLTDYFGHVVPLGTFFDDSGEDLMGAYMCVNVHETCNC